LGMGRVRLGVRKSCSMGRRGGAVSIGTVDGVCVEDVTMFG
jgi:hypothetical protein